MNKPTFIYAYDPLCGWCYGFHPVLQQLRERFRDRMNFEIVSGGLATGVRAETIQDGYGYIVNSLPQVEKVTGVKFGENFKMVVEEGSYFYNSEPPCIAQTVMKELAAHKAIDFGIRLKIEFFQNGKNMNQWKTYEQILENFEVDLPAFKKAYESEEFRQKTQNEFNWCKRYGATSFPTLLLRFGKETGVITRGYRPFEAVESHLHHLLNNLEKVT